MGLARGLVRGTVRGLVRGTVRSQSDPLALALAYYYSKASDGQTITEQRGLGAPNGTNGPTVAVESSDAYYAPYVASDGAYVDFPGTVDNFASVPDFAAANITGAIAIMATATLENWNTPSTLIEVCGRYTTSGNQRSYRLVITTTGEMQFFWSTNGTAVLALLDTADMSAVFANGTAGTFAVSFIPNDGSGNRIIRFYHSLDYGQSWVLRSEAIAASPTSIHAGTSPVYFAQFGTGGQSRLKLHSASIWSGALGASPTKVLDFNADSFSNGLTYTDPVSSQLVTLNQSTTGRPAFVVDETTFEADGVDKLLLFPSDPAYGIGAGAEFGYVGRFSIPAAVVNGGFLAATCDSSKNEGWGITVSTAGYLTATLDEGANRDTATGSISVLGKNSVAVALVVTAATLSVYADGVLHASVARTAGAVPAGLMRVFASGGVTAGGYQRGGWFGHEVQASAPTIAQQNAIAARLEALNA